MPEDADAPTKVDERPPPTDSDRALEAYARRMRPLRIAYAAGIVVVVVIALALVKIAYQRGEISHVTLKTAPAPPVLSAAPVPTKTPKKAWSNTDVTAIGAPIVGGTVVTHDEHTVRGRNARAGAETWSYTRTDRSVCTAIQASSVTVAVYRLHGNCDELTALSSETGQRLWTRTLDKDGAEFNGPATYAVNGGTVMLVSATSIYTIATGGLADTGNGGLDYWVFHHTGCTINGAVLGSAGALISQTCQGQDCKEKKFCGDGTQLLLRDQTAKYDEDSQDNPDAIKWNDLGTDLVPTSAGLTITARDHDGATLHVFDRDKGKQTAKLALAGNSGDDAPSSFRSGTDADIIWIGSHAYALASAATSFSWDTPATGQPWFADGSAVLDDGQVITPTGSGAKLQNGGSGKVETTYPIAPPAPGSIVSPLGTGLLVAGPQTIAYT